MNAFRRHWYSLGLIPAAVMAVWLAWNWDGIVWVQKLLALNFIVLILHQFEEYAWPGGFPWICNEVLTPKSGGPPDRYPLNQNNAAFIAYLIPPPPPFPFECLVKKKKWSGEWCFLRR